MYVYAMSSNFTPCSKDEGKKGKMAESKKFKGVRQRHWGSWVSEIRHPLLKKRVWLGTFQSAEEAARAYDQAAVIMCGRRAQTNFPVSQALHEQGEPKYKLKYKGSSLASSSSSSFSSSSNEISLSHILHAKLRKPNKASSPPLTCLRLDTESSLIGIWQNRAGSSSKSKWVTTVKLEKKDSCEESNKAQAGQEEVQGEKASPSLMSNDRLLGHGHGHGHGCTFVDEEEESVSLQMIQELLHGNSTCF